MARDGRDDPPVRVTQKVWTFLVLGGEPFHLFADLNPSLEHDGGRTMWKMVGTRPEAAQAVKTIQDQGAQVVLTTEEQSPEQERERLRLLGRGQEDS